MDLPLLSDAAEPWFSDPAAFGAYYGGLVGGIGGAVCGVLGALAGALAPKGRGRGFILGAMTFMCFFGVANLAIGITALTMGQPYAIWYPMVLAGGIFALVAGPLIFVVRQRYDEASERDRAAQGCSRDAV